VPAERAGRADYRIAARVDDPGDGTRRLVAKLVLEYRHNGPEPTSELWFHLYHNAFANNRSTHLAPLAGRLGPRRIESGFGWQRVTAARAMERDLMPSFRYRGERAGAGEEPAPEDRTVFSLELPRPLAAGQTVAVELEWEALVPRVRRRTGHKDDFLFLAHWFPKLGVWEPGRGWICHPFYSNTEFYADYGAYDVTLDLPEIYASAGGDATVGASGVPAGPSRKEDGRLLTRFVAPSEADRRSIDSTGRAPLVHGFTWTADPSFLVRGGTFHVEDWAARFPAEVELAERACGATGAYGLRELGLRDVEVVVLIQPEHAEQAERHFEATCAALFFYGLWYGGYPYERVTVVDPAWGAGAAGGMEYPTLFTAGTRMFTRPSMHTPEGVTVHECGHQFWYGLVGNNELEAAWLDEGFNSYTDSEVLWRVYGLDHQTTDFARMPFEGVALVPRPGERADRLAAALAGRRIPLPWVGIELAPLRESGFLDWWRDQPLLTFTRRRDDPRWHDRVRYLGSPDADRVDMPAFEYVDRDSYVVNSYPRTAVLLRTLKGLVGDEAFLRGMRLFSERWRYGHPYPEDFFEAFLEGSGADVRWYLEDVFRGTETVDWSVEVDQRRRPAPRGWFQAAPGEAFVEHGPDEELAKLEESEDEAPGEEAREREDDPRGWELDLVLRRRGGLALPLEVELRWADGTRERVVWTREAQHASNWWRPLGAAWAPSEKKLEAVVLDPERRIWLDLDLSDNQWHDAADRVTPLRWGERALTQYTHTLFWYGGLGG
jgi:hypothetical protein